jgi:hypothetical protein
MTTTPTTGGFTCELDQAFAPAAAGGCCGSAPAATAEAPAAASPCCGTAAQAQESGSCCGTAAKAEAVSAGQGCCG